MIQSRKLFASFDGSSMLKIYAELPETLGLFKALINLDARIATAQAEPERAIQHWEKAVEIEDKLNYER